MTQRPALPPGLAKTGQSKTFDQTSVPAGLQAEHQTRTDTWGKLIVEAGALEFIRSADPARPVEIRAGDHHIIEPGDPHHVRLTGPVKFFIEFYRSADP